MKVKLHWWLLLLAFVAGANKSAAQGTEFTYNGMLQENGNPANGRFDLSFSLYNAVTKGSLIGSVTNTATGVSNGLFVATLDFGAVFNGANYWLEIAARTNGGGAFTTLSPRQPLTPAPYAVYAPTAGSAATAVIASMANSVSATNLSGLVPNANLGNAAAMIQTAAAAATNFTLSEVTNLGRTLWPHTVFVSVNGSDTNAGTNILAPVLTISNALRIAANLGGSNLIRLGVGQFQITNNTVLGPNTGLVGEGAGQTLISFRPRYDFPTGYLAIEGDNVYLSGFTLGTNTANGWYYYPLSPEYGTNFYARDLRVVGNSDAVMMNGMNLAPATPFIGTFFNCTFSSGFDTVFEYSFGSNSALAFTCCTFDIVQSAYFASFARLGEPCRGMVINFGSWTVNNCTFNVEGFANAETCAIEENATASGLTVNNNIYNVTNALYPAQRHGINVLGGPLNVIGAINPANVSNAGGTVNYDAIQASYIAGTVGASNLTGTIPLGRLSGAVVTNGQKGVALSGTFSGLGSGLTNSAGHALADRSVTNGLAAQDYVQRELDRLDAEKTKLKQQNESLAERLEALEAAVKSLSEKK